MNVPFFQACFGRLGPAAVRTVLALLVLGALAPATSRAQDDAELRRRIEENRQSVETRRKSMERLAAEERDLGRKVRDLEAEAERLANDVAAKEEKVREVEREERKLAGEYAVLDKNRRRAAEKLTRVLRALWPARQSSLEGAMSGVGDWEEADRRFTWLAALYEAARQSYADYKEQSGRLAENLAAQEAARRKFKEQHRLVNAGKDELLAKRLEHLRQMRDVKKQRQGEEEEIKEILGVIGKLNYRLESSGGGDVAALRGRLPWPARGRVVAGFAPEASPPVRGLGLALASGTKVAAVHAGKVVHADKLRGMGDVVIVSHGDNSYAVYAYLGEVGVRVGQEVAVGESLGTAGFYPAANGPGLYFELRFREKAINPGEWLAKQS